MHIATAGGIIHPVAIGSVYGPIILTTQVLVPHVSQNLLSVPKLAKAGLTVIFDNSGIYIYRGNELLVRGRFENDVYVITLGVKKAQQKRSQTTKHKIYSRPSSAAPGAAGDEKIANEAVLKHILSEDSGDTTLVDSHQPESRPTLPGTNVLANFAKSKRVSLSRWHKRLSHIAISLGIQT